MITKNIKTINYKNQKMKRVLFAAIIIAAVSSCSKNNNSQQPPEGRNEICLSTGIAGTRAAFSPDSPVKNIQFIRVDATSEPTSFVGGTSILGSRATDGAITFGNTQYYAASDRSYFISYFPVGTKSENSVTWDIDVTTDILRTPLVADAGTNGAPLTPTLNYQHELAQLEVKCIAQDAEAATRWGKIKSIKLKNTASAMNFNLINQTVSPAEMLTDLTLVANDYQNEMQASDIAVSSGTPANDPVAGAGMFAPSASRQITLEVLATGATVNTPRVISIDFGTDKSFNRGEKHVVTLTFNKENVDQDMITATSTIEEWTLGATASNDIN